MSIDRNNCEACFLDYYEGRLSQEEVQNLILFLDQHPDLKSDFEAYGEIPDADVQLQASTLSSSIAGSLKKQPNDDDLIALLEGQLNSADRKSLEELLESDKNLAIRFGIYQNTILQPDLNIQFDSKKELKKGAPIIPLLLRYSSVAALLAGAFLTVWIWQYQQPTENLTVLNDSNEIRENQNKSVTDASEQSTAPADVEHSTENQSDNAKVESNAWANTSQASSIPKSAQVDHKNVAEHTPASESNNSKNASRQKEMVAMSALEPIKVATLKSPEIRRGLRSARNLPKNATLTTADLIDPKEEMTEPARTTLFGAFISDVGESMVDRLKTATGDNVVVEKKGQEESEIVTSTFKLGSFEVYRSRTKK